MRILVLTDHQKHNSTNSFYLIANSLFKSKEVQSVHVASRSDSRNYAFFSGESMRLSVKRVQSDLAYDSFDEWVSDSNEEVSELGCFDNILLRLPRPIHPNFFKFLCLIFPERNIINRPSGIVKTGSKAFLLELKDYTAPIRMVLNIEEIKEFSSLFPIVLKPLEEYGGRGLVKIDGDQVSIGNDITLSFKEFAEAYTQQPYLAMKFLRNVRNGDKRIVVAHGQVLTSSLRFPAEGSWLCNVAQGGAAEISTPTKEEEEIIEYIDPIMTSEGIFMYGLDTLEDDDGKRIISEVNTLSVGGIAPAAELSGAKLGDVYADLFINFVRSI